MAGACTAQLKSFCEPPQEFGPLLVRTLQGECDSDRQLSSSWRRGSWQDARVWACCGPSSRQQKGKLEGSIQLSWSFHKGINTLNAWIFYIFRYQNVQRSTNSNNNGIASLQEKSSKRYKILQNSPHCNIIILLHITLHESSTRM